MKKLLIFLILMSLNFSLLAVEINMGAISQIESSGNIYAYNTKSGAIGLFQITKICLDDYNQYHYIKYSVEQLWNPRINKVIGKWYIKKRVPQLLKYYKKPVTVKNILVSYNVGIKYVVEDLPLPIETQQYIEKYKKLTKNLNIKRLNYENKSKK